MMSPSKDGISRPNTIGIAQGLYATSSNSVATVTSMLASVSRAVDAAVMPAGPPPGPGTRNLGPPVPTPGREIEVLHPLGGFETPPTHPLCGGGGGYGPRGVWHLPLPV